MFIYFLWNVVQYNKITQSFYFDRQTANAVYTHAYLYCIPTYIRSRLQQYNTTFVYKKTIFRFACPRVVFMKCTLYIIILFLRESGWEIRGSEIVLKLLTLKWARTNNMLGIYMRLLHHIGIFWVYWLNILWYDVQCTLIIILCYYTKHDIVFRGLGKKLVIYIYIYCKSYYNIIIYFVINFSSTSFKFATFRKVIRISHNAVRVL